jgi:hypothetical protein
MKLLVYVECGNIGDIDDALGPSIDGGLIEKYAVITVDGAPILYDSGQDSAADYLSAMGMTCAGATEQ